MNDAPTTAATGLPFVKMHGLGNDFVVLDARRRGFALDARRIRLIADRRAGVGCDQLFVLEPPTAPAADVFMRIYNSDGGEVEACGNGARCVAALMMREKGSAAAVIETVAGVLGSTAAPDGRVTVDMGAARLGWREIPLARDGDTNHVPVAAGPLADASCINIGNPHAVFFVADAEAVDLRSLGPRLEHDPMFPERANIEVAQILGPDRIRMRVWERGVGQTMACGTGACAVLVAASRRGLVQRKAEIVMDGGSLGIEWLADDRVLMTGAVAISFTGTLAPAFFS
ncbi:MAG: diaminopimelate epimerase [Alphaproteobacteria bacterium]|nr:diaminopimelate epimerase [Alphaproteobacteria bacterium]